MTDTKFKFYKVGGYVRDKLLGTIAKDIDYTVVMENYSGDVLTAYELLVDHLEKSEYTIFLKTPECYTIRAKNKKINETADFVLARKEIGYDINSRKPLVTIGTLRDDLIRRDFTVNALAIDSETGAIIDVCGGINDLENRILKTPMDPEITLMDDPLRIIRGFRFSITKNLALDNNFITALHNDKIWIKFLNVVSTERICEELDKMFKFDTIKTLEILHKLYEINPLSRKILFKNIIFKPIVKHN